MGFAAAIVPTIQTLTRSREGGCQRREAPPAPRRRHNWLAVDYNTTNTAPRRHRHHVISTLRVATLAQTLIEEPAVSGNSFIQRKHSNPSICS